MSGDLYHWDTGTGNGTRRVPVTAPTTRNSSLVCWCFHPSPNYWDLTLLSGCYQEPVKSFQKGQPPEKAKLKRWWIYLSQFSLAVYHIPGRKNGLSDYISRNNFIALIGESSEALAKQAFQRMEVQLDLSMRTAEILEGWSLSDYQSEYKDILHTLSTGLEPCVIDGHQWYKNNQ